MSSSRKRGPESGWAAVSESWRRGVQGRDFISRGPVAGGLAIICLPLPYRNGGNVEKYGGSEMADGQRRHGRAERLTEL